MSNLILCYDEICQAEGKKYSEDPSEFFKKSGLHCNHKVAYFDDLCDDFIEQFATPQREQDCSSLLEDVDIMFQSFMKEFYVKMDKQQKILKELIQTKTKYDKCAQFYLSITGKDHQSIRECSDYFYQFRQPETIRDAYRENVNQAISIIVRSQTIMDDIILRIELMTEDTQQEIQNVRSQNSNMKQQNCNQPLIMDTKLEENLEVIQRIESINAVQEMESNQEIISLFYCSLIENEISQLNMKKNSLDLNDNQKEQNILSQRLSELKLMSEFPFNNLSISINKDFDVQIQDLLKKKIDFQASHKTKQNNKSLREIQEQVYKDLAMLTKNQNQASQKQSIQQENVKTKSQNSLELNDAIPQLKKMFSFSSQFISPSIQINSTNMITKTGADGLDMAIMIPQLDQYLNEPITFGFKIRATQSVGSIAIGMCHLQTIVDNQFLFIGQGQIGHGCYMISGHGSSFSTSDSLLNKKSKSFSFTTDDIIYCTFDPLNKSITFKKELVNKIWKLRPRKSCVLGYIPTKQQLHPCVLLYHTNNQVEYVQPE